MKYSHKVPQLHPKKKSKKVLSSKASHRKDVVLVYNELFRALAVQGRDIEFLSLWHDARHCTFSNDTQVDGSQLKLA